MTDQQICVLIAEDYYANLVAIGAIVEQCGYRWESADNGAQALEKIQAKSYDLILMDVQMPIMDGLQATKHIRDLEAEQNRMPVPILGLTALSQSQIKEDCLAAGMNDYVTKPFDIDNVKAMMASLIHERHNKRGAEPA